MGHWLINFNGSPESGCSAEVTLMGRELLNLAGTNINWISEPASNCNRTGNHLGIEPHTYKNVVESLAEDIEDQTGVTVNPSFNRKGAEILFITPSGDVFGDPGIYTMMGYMMLFGVMKIKAYYRPYWIERKSLKPMWMN